MCVGPAAPRSTNSPDNSHLPALRRERLHLPERQMESNSMKVTRACAFVSYYSYECCAGGLMARRTKSRITITIDPAMLKEIDEYVEEHKETDRSKVVGEALQTWYAQALHEALVRQHSAS